MAHDAIIDVMAWIMVAKQFSFIEQPDVHFLGRLEIQFINEFSIRSLNRK